MDKYRKQGESGTAGPVAVLFLDVVGFTELSRSLDSEQLSQLIDDTFRIFELTARAYGGQLNRAACAIGSYARSPTSSKRRTRRTPAAR
jgi:class 3 adenylate cyclase